MNTNKAGIVSLKKSIDAVARIFQVELHESRYFGIVFNDQDMGRFNHNGSDRC